ncbi:hypothetical protein VMT65_15585 [Nocardia sp. CDC153]|uniref:hypothetical protein n=1 Tax=Nocardia sp. CDC153 TaxID=3112167 RepID=UPI002DB95228|nr:hypothetical protein [Nocardia sp. CDC153]MEC3954463.1 hypothetical protein [Nocardia sp. CDC153]
MPTYTALLALHITVGTLGLLLGPVVAWTDVKSPPPQPIWSAPPAARHPLNGWPWYLKTLAAICITATVMVLWHRPDLWWLIPVSALTYALADLGHRARYRRGAWTHAYVHGLGGSYIALWTATLVVAFALNGPLYGPSELIAWLGPTFVALPLLELWRRHLRIPIAA